jgi:hypothetical protein
VQRLLDYGKQSKDKIEMQRRQRELLEAKGNFKGNFSPTGIVATPGANIAPAQESGIP